MQRFLLVLLAVLVTAPTARAWTWPADGPLLRPFVFGSDPYLGGQHRGIDVAGAAGAPVRAAAGGTVTFAGSLPGAGKTVTVQTADGYAVTHVHLGGISATEGSIIAEGAKVGTIGPSGEPEVDRPYVHLGVRVAAERHGYVDPLKLLPRRKTVAPPSAPKPPAATAPAPVKPAPPRVVTPKPAPKPAPVVRAPSPRPVQVPAPVVKPKPAPKPAPIVRAPSPRPVQAPTRPAKPVSAPAPRASVRPPGEKPTPEARSKPPVVRPVPEVKPRSTAPGAPRSAPERRQSVPARAKLAPPVFKLSEPDATPSSTKTRRGHASPSAVKTKPVPHEEASSSALSRPERKREVGERAAAAAPSPALEAAAGAPAAASASANVAESPAARETEAPSDAALGDRGPQEGTPTAALPAGQASPSIVALPETTAATSVGSPAPASGASEHAVEAGAAVGSAEAGATVRPQISRPASRADARPAAQAATALARGARPLWPAREHRREPQDGNPVAPAAAPAPRALARAARHAAPEPVGNASRDARKIEHGQPVAASDGSRVLYLLAGLLLAAGILVLAFRHRRPLGLPGRKRPRPASMPPALDAVAAEGSDEPSAAPAPAGGEDAIGLPPARTEPVTAASPSEALEGALCRRVRPRRSSRGVRPPRSRDHAARRHADRLTTSR